MVTDGEAWSGTTAYDFYNTPEPDAPVAQDDALGDTYAFDEDSASIYVPVSRLLAGGAANAGRDYDVDLSVASGNAWPRFWDETWIPPYERQRRRSSSSLILTRSATSPASSATRS